MPKHTRKETLELRRDIFRLRDRFRTASNGELARHLGISERTVRYHLATRPEPRQKNVEGPRQKNVAPVEEAENIIRLRRQTQ